MTRRSGYKEKFKKKMFPDVLAATPPNLVEKEQKQNKLEIFIDNNSIATECIFRLKRHTHATSRPFTLMPQNDNSNQNFRAIHSQMLT